MRLPLPFHCVLQPWKLEFLEDLMKASNYPEIARFMAPEFPCPYNETTGLAFLKQAMSDNPTQAFAIMVGTKIVGSIAVQPNKETNMRAAEIGYWLSPPYWNRGIASASIACITNYAFSTWDIAIMYSEVHPDNKASTKALERNGFSNKFVLPPEMLKRFATVNNLLFVKTNLPTTAN
jgi:RimJ/RimL family protein N-acetyltransferase